MAYLKGKIKTIILLGIIVLGLLAGVYLVQRQQTYKSKAAEINTALTITDENGKELEYQGNNTYKTYSQDINISVSDLKQLKSVTP